ncbi:hypothetical protein AB0283_33455, partial [Micromonospora vinacea]
MGMARRSFLGRTAAIGVASATGAVGAVLATAAPARAAVWKKRLTGADLDTSSRWRVAGTDLGIPY